MAGDEAASTATASATTITATWLLWDMVEGNEPAVRVLETHGQTTTQTSK